MVLWIVAAMLCAMLAITMRQVALLHERAMVLHRPKETTAVRLDRLKKFAWWGIQARAWGVIATVMVPLAALATAFPGQMVIGAVTAALLVPVVLALSGMFARGSDAGWFLDAIVPDRLLLEQIDTGDLWQRYETGWHLAGRFAALRRAAALHPEAPNSAQTLIMAQYAPGSVVVAVSGLRKSLMDEVRLRLRGWRVLVSVALGAGVLSIVLMVLLPQAVWDRLFAGSDRSGLQSKSEEQSSQHDDKPEPPSSDQAGQAPLDEAGAGPAAQGRGPSDDSAAGQGASSDGGSSDKGGSDAAHGTEGSQGESSAGQVGKSEGQSGEGALGTPQNGNEIGQTPGTETGSPAESSGGAARNGQGGDTGAQAGDVADDAKQDAAQNEPQDEAQAASQDGKKGGQDGADRPANANGDGTDGGEGGVGMASGETASKDASSPPSDKDADQDGAGSSTNAGEGADTAPNGAKSYDAGDQVATGDTGGTAAGTGGSASAGAADGTTPGVPAEAAAGAAESEGTAGQATAPGNAPQAITASGAEPDVSGADPVDVTPDEAAGLAAITTDEPIDGGMPSARPEPSQKPPLDAAGAGLAASAPEGTVAPDIAAGSAAQLFAEGGEVPDAVTMAISPDTDATLPASANPTPPRQVLPAWIKELVN